jgi:hypothetical protein
MEESRVVHSYDKSPEPVKVKLMKMSRGMQWEITVSGSSLAEVLPQLRQANNALKDEYGTPVEEA